MELAIGIVVVVGIILLLGRLADWFEERSFVLWLVFYLLAGGLTIALFGTANAVHQPPARIRPLGPSPGMAGLLWPYNDAQRRRSLHVVDE